MPASLPFDRDISPELVPSAQPAVVFASLVLLCAPTMCDRCTVDLYDNGARYRLEIPSESTSMEDPSAAHSVQRAISDEVASTFHGIATFTWHRRIPSVAEVALTGVLVAHATQTVILMRSEDRLRDADRKVEHLELALESNRSIGTAVGILMARHRLTREGAFQLLSEASQRTNQKVRDLAQSVIESGWLDPSLLEPRQGLTLSPNSIDLADRPRRVGVTRRGRRIV